jgi:TIGR03009 family protein
MRRLVISVGTLATVLGAAAVGLAQQGAMPQRKGAVAPAPVDANAVRAKALARETAARQAMETLYGEWEKRSAQTTSLSVGFRRTDQDPGFGVSFYQGQALLQSPDLACLNFEKEVTGADGKPVIDAKTNRAKTAPHDRVVCTGKEVLQYTWDDRTVHIYPLGREARQKALQQGPLPFLFNFKAAEAKQRYDMKLIQSDEQNYTVTIEPKLEEDRAEFDKAFLYLSKANLLPTKLFLMKPNGESQKFEFGPPLVNAAIKPGYFAKLKLDGWKEIYPEVEAATPSLKPSPTRDRQAAPKQAAQPGARPGVAPR